ncbi:TPA: hypothetical protein QBQ93_005438 [Pseudomonas aeruginosa]|nr:hypothetical protein [Pseudomonas aeruginosa]
MIPPGAQTPCPAGTRGDEATQLRRFVASVPNRISIGAARAVSECRDGPRVRLLSPGWRLNGRNLSLLEAAEVIDLYLDIARAQARLRQLGEIPPSASSSLPTPRIFP